VSLEWIVENLCASESIATFVRARPPLTAEATSISSSGGGGIAIHHPDLDRETLYADFRPLFRRLLCRYAGKDHELYQDLDRDMYSRFCAVLDAYDPVQGVPLRPYIIRRLTASIATFTHLMTTEKNPDAEKSQNTT